MAGKRIRKERSDVESLFSLYALFVSGVCFRDCFCKLERERCLKSFSASGSF